jgi:uncharacterized membrane protein YbaN (DUF454 family)
MPRRDRSRPPSTKHRIRNIVLGAVFFLLGVIGIAIPVMPQFLFFVLSFFFFSLAFPPLQRWFHRFLARHPKLARYHDRWRKEAKEAGNRWKARWNDLKRSPRIGESAPNRRTASR